MNVLTCITTAESLEDRRAPLSTNTVYCVTDDPEQSDPEACDAFAWSPDGVGLYWYDTYDEARNDI